MTARKRQARYEFKQSDTGGPYWWYHLKAANNAILCHSETYTTRASCLRAIAAHRRAAQTELVRERG